MIRQRRMQCFYFSFAACFLLFIGWCLNLRNFQVRTEDFRLLTSNAFRFINGGSRSSVDKTTTKLPCCLAAKSKDAFKIKVHKHQQYSIIRRAKNIEKRLVEDSTTSRVLSSFRNEHKGNKKGSVNISQIDSPSEDASKAQTLENLVVGKDNNDNEFNNSKTIPGTMKSSTGNEDRKPERIIEGIGVATKNKTKTFIKEMQNHGNSATITNFTKSRRLPNKATRMAHDTITLKPPYFGVCLRTVLHWWHMLAKRSNITYFLTAGSLFASYIHGDLLKGDSDLDVLVDYRHLQILESFQAKRDFDGLSVDNKFRVIMQPDWRQSNGSRRRRQKCNGELVESLVDNCSFQEPMARIMHNAVYMDVFAYSLQKNVVASLINGQRISRRRVFPLRHCRLLGVKSYCPRQTKYFLKVHYGKERFNQIYEQFKGDKPMIDWESFEDPCINQ